MTRSIALSGKGGVGKTTVAALAVKTLLARGRSPVFAVDADPNSNLPEQLGIASYGTVGDMREQLLRERDALPPGTSKADWIGWRLAEIVVESRGFDLISMGRPEGPGCYCYVNSLLREYLDARAGAYPWVVIDNEAGMEHLSRRTTRDVDTLVVVTDPTAVALTAAVRIAALAESLPLRIGRVAFLVNRAEGADGEAERRIRDAGFGVLGTVPSDPRVAARSRAGGTLLDIEDESPAYRAVAGIVDELCARGGEEAGHGSS